jgi:hypothetical protein
MKEQLVNLISTVIDTIMEIPLQEALFPIHREINPRCKARELRFPHPKDVDDMLLRNISI